MIKNLKFYLNTLAQNSIIHERKYRIELFLNLEGT